MTNSNRKSSRYFTPRIILMDVLFWLILMAGLYLIVFQDWLDAIIIGTSVYGVFVLHNLWKRRRDAKQDGGGESQNR